MQKNKTSWVSRKLAAGAMTAGMMLPGYDATARMPEKPESPKIVQKQPDNPEVEKLIRWMETIVATPDGMQPTTPEQVKILIDQLGDDDYVKREEASAALAKAWPPAVDAITDALRNNPSPEVRIRAARLEGVARYAHARAVSFLLNYAVSLKKEGAAAEPAVPVLMKAIKISHPELRKTIADIIMNIGLGAKAAVPDLVRVLKEDANQEVKEKMALALAAIGPAAESAIPDLIETLQDKGFYARRGAAEALGKIGAPANEKVTPALLKLLKDPYGVVRERAATALEVMPPLKAGMDELSAALQNDNHVKVRNSAARIIAKSNMKDAAHVLTDALQNEKMVTVQEEIAAALGQIGAQAREAVPVLEKLKNAGDKAGAGSWEEKEMMRRNDAIGRAIEQIKGNTKGK